MFTRYIVLAATLFASTSALAISTMQPVLTCTNNISHGPTFAVSLDQHGLMAFVVVQDGNAETYGYNGDDNSSFILSTEAFNKYGGHWTGYSVGVEQNGKRMTLDYAIGADGKTMPHSGLLYTETVAGQIVQQHTCDGNQGLAQFAAAWHDHKIHKSYMQTSELSR